MKVNTNLKSRGHKDSWDLVIPSDEGMEKIKSTSEMSFYIPRNTLLFFFFFTSFYVIVKYPLGEKRKLSKV